MTARTITFTSFEDEQTTHEKLIKTGALWYLYGRETCPKTGKKHLQGMAYSKDSIRWLTKMSPIHVESCKDPEASIKYCSKDGDVVEFGNRPTWNKKGQKLKTLKQLMDVPEEERKETLTPFQYLQLHKAEQIAISKSYSKPNLPRKCIWIYGDTGVGKSRYVNVNFPNAYVKQQNKWWDLYTQQKVVHLEDFDLSGACLGHYLKLWADPWTPEIKGERKGEYLMLGYETFIITSQYTIGQIWPETKDQALRDAISRRFEFYDFNSKPPSFD